MVPTGFPAVVRDGVEALRWAAGVLEKALPRVSDWVAELAPSEEKAKAEAKEWAKREGLPLVISYRDSNGWTREFTDQQRELVELATRLERRTASDWASGGAAAYFTGLDLCVFRPWQHDGSEMLLQWLGEGGDQARQRRADLTALAQWLNKYLDANA